jgi:hypothetical protein
MVFPSAANLIPRPEQNGALSLKRANQLLDITDKILTRSRQELALQNEAWMVLLWALASENEILPIRSHFSAKACRARSGSHNRNCASCRFKRL